MPWMALQCAFRNLAPRFLDYKNISDGGLSMEVYACWLTKAIYNCEGIPVFNMPSRLLHATISAAFLDYFFFQKNQICCVAFIFNTVNHVLIPAPYNWCCICNLQRYNEFCRIILFFISAFALISASPTMRFLPYILQYFGSCKPIIIINSTFMLFGNL